MSIFCSICLVLTHIRTHHRIHGNLIGSLPQYPRDTSQNGLPLSLMPEEVRLLLSEESNSKFELVESQLKFESQPKIESLKQQLDSEFTASINRKIREDRTKEIESNLDKIIEGRLRKNSNSNPISNIEEFRQKTLEELKSKIEPDLPLSKITFKRFETESKLDSIRIFRKFELEPLEPRSLGALRYATFRHFWSLGYHLTEGQKFGGDFLAYDHDPIAFHAKFIIRCILDSNQSEEEEEEFEFESQPYLLQAYGRLGKNVRKYVILASFASGSDDQLRLRHIRWNSIV